MSHLVNSFHGAASFGKGERQPLYYQTNNPSPGQYDSKIIETRGKWKFGASIRKEQINNNPSVGDYNINIKDDRKIKIMIKGKQQDNQIINHNSPGPGSYQVEEIKTNGHQYGFGYKFQQDHSSDGQGPQKYKVQYPKHKISFNKKNGSLFGSGNKDSIYQRSISPSPGQYDISYARKSAVSFTKGKRDAYYSRELTPGPNQYNTITKSNSKGISFGSKSTSNHHENIPGPGQYSIQVKSKKSFSFGSSKKIGFQEESKNPGPGNYDLNTTSFSKGCKFPLAKKETLNNKSENPGPGQYETLQSFFSHQGGFINDKPRNKAEKFDDTPGPGYYQIHLEKKPSTRGDSQFGSRASRYSNMKQQKIGPGSYMKDGQFDNDKLMTYSFSRAKSNRTPDKPKLYTQNPGPGKYEITSDIGYIPKYLAR